MSERTLSTAPLAAIAEDVRTHGYAIVQTATERVPANLRSAQCAYVDGCFRPATLVTLAVAEVADEGGDTTRLRFERDAWGDIIRIAVCNDHRCEASHDLYYALTERTRPDGLRAFDLPAPHTIWP